MSKDKVRKKSTGVFGLVTLKKSVSNYVRNPTSYIELAIQEVGIPLTIKCLDNSGNEVLSTDDIMTIHNRCELRKFECLKPNGELCEVPTELSCRVKYISINKSTVYHTVADVLQNRQDDKITWIVVTKPFVYQAFVYNPGLIFEVLSEEKDEETLSVEVHPGRLLVFLPLQLSGDFRKCDSPYYESECDLNELWDTDAPFFITPTTADINKLYTQNIELPRDRLFVRSKKSDYVLIGTSRTKGELFHIHTFPVDYPLKCEILLGGKPVDMLTEDELSDIKKKLIMCDVNKTKTLLSMTYDIAGVKRIRKKRNGKIRKKDIHAPQALEDSDYARYMEAPTNILKDLSLNFGGWGYMNTVKNIRNGSQSSAELSNDGQTDSVEYSYEERLKNQPKSVGRRSVHSLQFENLTVDEVVDLLCNLSLHEHAQTVRNEQINGKLLTLFDANDFIELGLEKTEAQKLFSFLNGSYTTIEYDDSAVERIV